ncbi:hypothetical protein GYB57_14765 [bacterium]|nr:hypothetical protein [bacterium]
MNESSLEKIENLNQEFLEISENEYDKFIHFYDNNKNFIEHIDINQSEQHLYLKLKVIGNYGRALFLTAKFKEAISSLEEAIKIMSSKNLTDFYYYEFLRSIYGESLYFSKNYKKAKDIFLKLKTDFPEKRIYSSWYNYSHFRSLKWITSILLVIGGLLIVGDKYINPDNPFVITIIGITVIALTILGEWIIKQLLNKNHTIAQKEKITNPNNGYK